MNSDQSDQSSYRFGRLLFEIWATSENEQKREQTIKVLTGGERVITQFYLLLSPYLCFISSLFLELYVLGDDALMS